jgi:hypothetical protein
VDVGLSRLSRSHTGQKYPKYRESKPNIYNFKFDNTHYIL